MMLNFSEDGHPVFRGSCALERGALRSKGKSKLSIHFCGDDDMAELVLRTIISVSQLNFYGAVADMCDELTCRISGCSESTGKLVAQNNSETMVMPTELSTKNKTPRTNETLQGNLLHDFEHKIANLPDHLQLMKLCSNVGITKTVPKGQFFTTIDDVELVKLRCSCQAKTLHRDNAASKSERMDPWEHEDRSSFGSGSKLPSRPLRNRDHDELLIWRWNLVPG